MGLSHNALPLPAAAGKMTDERQREGQNKSCQKLNKLLKDSKIYPYTAELKAQGGGAL